MKSLLFLQAGVSYTRWLSEAVESEEVIEWFKTKQFDETTDSLFFRERTFNRVNSLKSGKNHFFAEWYLLARCKAFLNV